MGAMNKLNEYYADDTIIVVNLSEEKNTVCELSYEEFQVEQRSIYNPALFDSYAALV